VFIPVECVLYVRSCDRVSSGRKIISLSTTMKQLLTLPMIRFDCRCVAEVLPGIAQALGRDQTDLSVMIKAILHTAEASWCFNLWSHRDAL